MVFAILIKIDTVKAFFILFFYFYYYSVFISDYYDGIRTHGVA